MTSAAVTVPFEGPQQADFTFIPRGQKARVLGVEYVPLRLSDGGELYLTAYGWPWRQNLLPQAWFAHERYLRQGVKLPRSTGHVYRLPTVADGRRLDIVIKVSRMAQHVPILVLHDHGMAGRDPRAAEFCTPFDEVAWLERLRNSRQGPAALRIRTKRALAIYSPPTRYQEWQLGRAASQMGRLARRLSEDQQDNGFGCTLELHPHRDYLLLYAWIKGENAEELFDAGVLTGQDLEAIAHQAAQDLQAKGFCVLDHKPNHVILRRRPDGRLLARQGRLVYALADFELLIPASAEGTG